MEELLGVLVQVEDLAGEVGAEVTEEYMLAERVNFYEVRTVSSFVFRK